MLPVLSARFKVMMPRPRGAAPVLIELGALAHCLLGDGEQRGLAAHDHHVDHPGPFLVELDPLHAVDCASLSRTSFSWKRNAHAVVRGEHECRSDRRSPARRSARRPSPMLIARMPTERGLPNSDSRVFSPRPVGANRRYWSSENSARAPATRGARRASLAMQEMMGLPRGGPCACGICAPSASSTAPSWVNKIT